MSYGILRNEVARRFGPALLFALASTLPTAAGDMAQIDLLGFSHDKSHFAFEEYGVEDGSNLPYSNVFILDLREAGAIGDASVRRIAGDDADADLATIRAEAAKAATARLAELKIDTPAVIAALVGDGISDLVTSLSFGFPAWGPPGTTQEDYEITLESFEAPLSPWCEGATGKAALGFALFLSSEGTRREIYRDKGPLPQWRGCPLAYRLHAAVYPFEGAGIDDTVAIVSSYPFGFEGPDRRFLAAPLLRQEN